MKEVKEVALTAMGVFLGSIVALAIYGMFQHHLAAVGTTIHGTTPGSETTGK